MIKCILKNWINMCKKFIEKVKEFLFCKSKVKESEEPIVTPYTQEIKKEEVKKEEVCKPKETPVLKEEVIKKPKPKRKYTKKKKPVEVSK